MKVAKSAKLLARCKLFMIISPKFPPHGDYFVPNFANVWKADIDKMREAGINVAYWRRALLNEPAKKLPHWLALAHIGASKVSRHTSMCREYLLSPEACHEQAESASNGPDRRSTYSTTMIESRSGAVSPEIEEMVTVFEPA
jgi:hypothetical protein